MNMYLNTCTYRFELDRKVPLAEAEMSLRLALLVVEGLVGQARVRLETACEVDADRHCIVVDGNTPAGVATARVLAGLLIREFGENAFQVRRCRSATSVAGAAGNEKEVA